MRLFRAKSLTKLIGIFYGAGHMPDFEKRLREEFGLRGTKTMSHGAQFSCRKGHCFSAS